MEISITGKIIALSIVAVGIALPIFLIMFHCCFACISYKKNSDSKENEEETIFGPLSKNDVDCKGHDSSAISKDN